MGTDRGDDEGVPAYTVYRVSGIELICDESERSDGRRCGSGTHESKTCSTRLQGLPWLWKDGHPATRNLGSAASPERALCVPATNPDNSKVPYNRVSIAEECAAALCESKQICPRSEDRLSK